MKPQEAELVTEISKLQCMVSELKTGFSSALMELSHIQHGDTFLREELEENRRSCRKKAAHLEALVETLREELGVMQCQLLQLYSHKQRPLQDAKSSKHTESGEPAAPRRDCAPAAAAGLTRGKLLLHCFLQGLKAGLSEGTDARHQVALQLLHSEWEYVSTLNQLYDRYRSPLTQQISVHQTHLKFVEQLLQRHLAFRNTLQERLSAEHWKSLVGDILVQLIGQNDTAFADMYLGYTTTLASFLSLEFSSLNLQRSNKMQSGQTEREEMKLLSLLLAPVSRVHSYLSHIQNLLQWTGKEHPDCSLLLGAERALRSVLSRCHVVLEEDVRWEEAAAQSCSEAAGSSASCCTRSQPTRAAHQESVAAAHRDQQQVTGLTNGLAGCHAMHLERWSCSPVRRKSCGRERSIQNPPAVDCGHAYCSLLTPDAAGWGDNSDSGQGTFSQHTGKGTNELEGNHTRPNLEDCETDPDDTSAFDYSSVTSCSPDGTLRREDEEDEGDEGDEDDSQVPVLLKPSCSQQRETPRERTVCLRWQIPRLTPHPLPRSPTASCADGPKPCLVSSYGKRLVNVKKGSPPLHPKSAFRPIWDDPSKQADSAPERDSRQGFVPIQAAARQQSFQNFNPSRDALRPGLPQQRGGNYSGGLWDDSEDSEGPCSTV